MVVEVRKKYNMRDVVSLLGIYRGTIINYEKRGIFPLPDRNPINGYREYSEDDIKNLKSILEGKNK